MSYTLLFTEQYEKKERRFFKRHPDLLGQYRKVLRLLEANPHHPSLRLHSLTGRLTGLHSVSINLSYRITIELLLRESEIIPIDIGDHEAIYRQP